MNETDLKDYTVKTLTDAAAFFFESSAEVRREIIDELMKIADRSKSEESRRVITRFCEMLRGVTANG